eukprot:maker-scaffold445_size168248-snap-gene-0.26 protein:Tk06583 transcript:maker-scaffold445_size168248-snap-gene-0.26-mRNA-1 annotation:"aaa domain-containing protein"
MVRENNVEQIELPYGVYSGEVHDGKPNGHGTLHFNNGDNQGRQFFEGTWADGVRRGPGRMIWNTGEEFNGEWRNNLQTGQGEHRFASGDYDVAIWERGLRHGPATYIKPSGSKEEATYVEGYENGPSVAHFAT